MGKNKVNYDSMTVTFNNEPSEKALLNYYCLLIDVLAKKYGKDYVRIALDELVHEYQEE